MIDTSNKVVSNLLARYRRYGENFCVPFFGNVRMIIELSDKDISVIMNLNEQIDSDIHKMYAFILNDVLMERRKFKINKIKNGILHKSQSI